MNTIARALGLILLIQAFGLSVLPKKAPAQLLSPETTWVTPDAEGKPQIHPYFFWTTQCPHCREALPFIDTMSRFYPWLIVHSHDLTRNPADAGLYIRMAERIGRRAESVPGFLFCGEMHVGYDTDRTTGAFLQRQLQACYEKHLLASARGEPQGESEPDKQTDRAETPVDEGRQVQPGTLDDSAESVGDMGGEALGDEPPAESARFDPEGGKVYDGAMAPIMVPILGEIAPARYSLPVFTLIIAGLDAFNPCAFFVLLFLLSLLVRVQSRTRMFVIGGIFVFFSGFIYFVFMAAWLNLFLFLGELKVITMVAGLLAVSILGDLPTGAYYLYLLLYNVIYVVPLALIVAAFTVTMNARRMSEREGRLLKLLSGTMMLALGVLLLTAPQLLSNVVTAAALLVAAVTISALVVLSERLLRGRATA